MSSCACFDLQARSCAKLDAEDGTSNPRELNTNATKYPNPLEFYPERFEDYPLSTAQYMNTDHRDHYSFGAGRRQVSDTPFTLREADILIFDQPSVLGQ